MIYCHQCGRPTTPADPFCGVCGARQSVVAVAASSGAIAAAVPAAVIYDAQPREPVNLQLVDATLLANRYSVVKRIGGGGMGSVYRAEDRNLGGRPVAVKEMLEMFAEETARKKAIEDFRRESELLARLEHPSIPTIYDYFFDVSRGRYYLVMKFIEGSNLEERLKAAGGIIDEASVTRWAIQACNVLDYIHSQRPPIIYRDLKPANLMIDAQTDRLMLVDFGIARFVAPGQQKGVTAIGTMGYAPPELFSGNVDARSDIYSLGATMFHLLTGRSPQDDPLLVFDFSKRPKPVQINPAITPRMEAILLCALAHDPEDRFGSARVLGAELERHLDDLRLGRLPNAAGMIGSSPPAKSVPGHRTACFHCGQTLYPDDPFCAWCGQKQQ